MDSESHEQYASLGVCLAGFRLEFQFWSQAGYDIGNDNVPYSLIGPGFTFRPPTTP